MKLLGVVLKHPLHKPLVKRVELYADKGYDSKCNRHLCTGHGLFDRISKRKVRISKRSNAKRIVVENTFAWIDKYRRLIMRYENFQSTYESYTFLALSDLLYNRFLRS